MSKKITKKQIARAGRIPVSEMRGFFSRIPEPLYLWLNETAASLGLSRDAFLRQLIDGSRKGFELANVDGSDESVLFRRLEDKLVEAAGRAADEAVRSALLNQSAAVAVGRVAGKGAK